MAPNPVFVLRFPRTDEDGAFVLVKATQFRAKPLDLQFVGTDGLAPYVASLRHDRAATLMVKNSPCSEDEWIEVLTSILRQDPKEGLEAVAAVENESSITITFRKRIRGITQRLGTLELKHNPDEEIELFDWCGIAAEAVIENKTSQSGLSAKTNELEDSLSRLRKQLDELIEAKKADEDQLLSKFQQLLNEKKVKIREQQRALAQAKVDPENVPEIQDSDTAVAAPNNTGRKAGPSRSSKRKAVKAKVQESESEDDGFDDKMNVDAPSAPAPPAAELSEEERETTDAGTETESDDDGEGEEAQAPAKPSGSAASKAEAEASQTSHTTTASKEKEAPPPKRDLPFARRGAGRTAAAQAPPAGGGSDSDDEL